MAIALIHVIVYDVPTVFEMDYWKHKPFNCSRCMSFWVSTILSIAFINPIFYTIYIGNEILERIKL